jgi:hypothetical protein
MPGSLNTIFKRIAPPIEPAASLKDRILAAIALEFDRRVRRERRAASIGMALSAIVASVAGAGYGGELIRSDFWSIISLIFSDASSLVGYWDSFLYSLLETFPAAAAAAFVLPVFVFLVSLGMYSRFRQDADRRSRYAGIGHHASTA